MAKVVLNEDVRYAYVRTKKFYRKYAGMVSVNNKCKILKETIKAYQIRQAILKNRKIIDFGDREWIPKSSVLYFRTLENIVEAD